MSSSLAGKFQDHYDVLGVDPKAESDAIERAYAKLAQKYHPTAPTADAEKFEAVNMAYEVLSDPGLRLGFDRLKGVGAETGVPVFSGLRFFEALGRENSLRSAVLCILYDRRRTHSFKPSLSLRNIESMIEASSEEVNFALWYLKQRSFAASDDKSNLQITVEGMDFLESNRPSPELIMPFVKTAAKAVPPEQSVGARLVSLVNRAR